MTSHHRRIGGLRLEGLGKMGLFYLFLFWLPELLESWHDPLSLDDELRRKLRCELLSVERAHQLRPGALPVPRPRGDFFERRALLCRALISPEGERHPRDEAILAQMSLLSESGVSLLRGSQPEASSRRWQVEVIYPNPAVAAKLRFALKLSLLNAGLRPLDAPPRLSADSLRTLATRPTAEGVREACKQYARPAETPAGFSVLIAALRHQEETQLHFARCDQGTLRWLS